MLSMTNTERCDKDRAIVPPTSLAAPATMAVVVPRCPGRRTLSSGWASPLRHRCPRHRPGCYCLPSNLVAVAIALAAIADTRFVARHPRPPMSPSPSPSPSSLPLPLLACHHCLCLHCSCHRRHCLFVGRHPHHHQHCPCHPHLPSLSPTSLVTITITHFVAVAVAIALVAVNCLPPSLLLLLPQKPSLSSLHSTLVTNVIARFIPLALFVTRHPYPHCHCLAALTLFDTCSHC